MKVAGKPHVRSVLLKGVSALALMTAMALQPNEANATACSIDGHGSISANCTGYANISSQPTLTNTGTILSTVVNGADTSAEYGVRNNGSIGNFVNRGSISGGNGVVNAGATAALGSIGTIHALSNSGTIAGERYAGVWNQAAGVIDSITNSATGLITGQQYGISNSVSSDSGGVWFGTITALTNNGTISSDQAIYNSGSIGTLSNNGTILGYSSGVIEIGIVNAGNITSLSNSGAIKGGFSGIFNSGGSIGALTNSSTIWGGLSGINNNTSGSIGRLTNKSGGIITGNAIGLYNYDGGIGALINENGGTISGGSCAINTGGSMGVITNSGVIAGNIYNWASHGLTINGGSGSTYGLLTGYNNGSASTSNVGTVGTITNMLADLLFASGNIWLNDNVNVTGHSLLVTHATVKVSSPITITGSYSQTGGGLVVSRSGSINISGNSAATVTGTAITISGTNLTAGSYTIVNANAVGNYTGDSLTITGVRGLSGVLSTADSGNDLVATLTGTAMPETTYTGTGQTAGGAAAGMGSALDAIAAATGAQATAFQTNVLSVLSSLPTSAQQTAIKQLAPTQITPAVLAATQAAAPTTSVIEQHELALLDGAGAAAGSAGHQFGLWGQILGGTALRSGNAEADGYRSQNFGLVSGLDYQLDADTTLGGALSWVKGWSWGADNSAGSYTTTNSYQITGYGLHRWGAAFVDGQIGFGYNTYDQTRGIGFLGQDAKASYNGEQYLAKAGVGYDVALGDGLIVTPLAGWRFLRAVSDGYTESGSSANLTVDRRGVQSLTQDLGGKVSWALDSDWGKLTPEVRLAWVHDYTKGPIASSGIMGGQVFTSTVARPNPDGAKLNLAATLETMGDVSFRAEYEGELRPDYQSHSGLIKATWGF